MQLMSPYDRGHPDPAEDGPVRVDRAHVPGVEHRARGSLANCSAYVIATPHLVAVHALETTTEVVISQLRSIDRSEKMSKLFHFLDQGLGAYAKKGRYLDLPSLAELVAGNRKESMESEVAAGIYFVDMRLPLGCC